VGLAARATLLRPGRAERRDATGFPPALLDGAPPGPELQVIALPGVTPPLALVQPGATFTLRAVACDGGTREVAALLGAVAAVAQRAGGERLECAGEDPRVDRAARWLGFYAAAP
jgi:hypothetical protein